MANKEKTRIDEADDISRLRQYITEGSTASSLWHAKIWSDLKFLSGDQWDSDIAKARRLKSKPVITLNSLKTYINRIVNPVRLNPISASVNSDDKLLDRMVNGVLRGIDRASKASEAYECAMECAAAAGVGYYSIIVEESPILKGKNVIAIKPIRNPTSVLFDPWSESVTGCDGRWCVTVNWISKDRAKAEYNISTGAESLGWLYGSLSCPPDSVGDIVLYEMIDGEDAKSESNEISEEFNSGGSKCRVTRYIGTTKIAQETYESQWLLIVPVYGNRVWTDSNIKWSGIVDQARDNQCLVNFYASNELELAALAPKSPFIAGKEQIEGLERYWNTANTEAHAVLPYNMMGPGGVVLPAPQRADNTAQTQGLMQSRMSATDGMGKLLGITDAMLGGNEAMSESGTALRTRLGTGELPTAQYVDNLAKSIEHGTQIQIALMSSVYQGIRPVTVVDEKGKAGVARIDVASQLTPVAREMLSIETSAGPSFESRRRESISGLTSLIQMGGPEAVAQSFDLIAEMQNTPEGDMMAARWRKLHPELADDEEEDGDIDPKVKSMLQEASDAVDHLEELDRQKDGLIAQLQAKLEASEATAAAKVYEAELRAQTDIEIKAMDCNNKVELKLLDLNAISGDKAVETTELQRSRALAGVSQLEQPDIHTDVIQTTEAAMPQQGDAPAPRIPQYLQGNIENPIEMGELPQNEQPQP